MAELLLGGTVGLAIHLWAMAGHPPSLDPEQFETGRKIYEENCASCHGAESEGAPNWREPDAMGELPAPPHGPDGHTWRHSDALLREMIREGYRDPFNRTDRLTMPPFGDFLEPAEIRAVIAYLKTLWTPEQRRFQWEESQKTPALPDPEPE